MKHIFNMSRITGLKQITKSGKDYNDVNETNDIVNINAIIFRRSSDGLFMDFYGESRWVYGYKVKTDDELQFLKELFKIESIVELDSNPIVTYATLNNYEDYVIRCNVNVPFIMWRSESFNHYTKYDLLKERGVQHV